MLNMRGYVAFLVCLIALAISISNRLVNADGWADIPTALSGTPIDFHNLVGPLTNMTTLSYTSTNGSYFRKGSLERSVDGWERVKTVDPGIGMRAVVFVKKDSGQGVIAYRGTDLKDPADICFDAIMMSAEIEGPPLPAACGKLPEKILDYFGNAKKVVEDMMEEYPDVEFLFSGHSLGCALATMMSVEFREKGLKTVCFSQPGVENYVKFKTSVTDKELAKLSGIYVLADSQDPLTVEAAIANEVIGKLYVWESTELIACTDCCCELKQTLASNDTQFSQSKFSHGPCAICFAVKHTFSNYVDLVKEQEITAKLEPLPSAFPVCECNDTLHTSKIKLGFDDVDHKHEDVEEIQIRREEHMVKGSWVVFYCVVFIIVTVVVMTVCGYSYAKRKKTSSRVRIQKYVELEETR